MLRLRQSRKAADEALSEMDLQSIAVAKNLKSWLQGQTLETVRIGGRRFTSVEAMERFFSAIDEAAEGFDRESRTPKQRELALKSAEEQLRREGI